MSQNDTLSIQVLDTVQYTLKYDTYNNTKNVAECRLFGRNIHGQSVMVHVHGFHTYFYIKKWNAYDQEWNALKQHLVAHDVDIVDHTCVQGTSLWGYQFKRTQTFVKIRVKHPKHIYNAKRAIETYNPNLELFETNVPYELRYMIDINLKGAAWCTLTRYTKRLQHRKTSSCDIECDVMHTNVTAHEPNTDTWLKNAPIKIMSVDI